MWNQIQTDVYEGMLAETVTVSGYKGDRIHAYLSRPLGVGPYPSIVLIPHMPGWDEFNKEVARRFTHHGYITICPNIYERYGHGLPDDIAVKAREDGGVSDESVMDDCEGMLTYLKSLPYSTDKVGIIGMCSGGRHAFLAGCSIQGFSAVADCWGGGVVMSEEMLSSARPKAPIDLIENLNAPLIGIFGNDDVAPTAEQVDLHEQALKKYNKDYEFYRYDDAGHAFWNYTRDSYRATQTMDSWEKVMSFFEKHLK